MDDNLEKELNKFLKGIHMGASTFKDYLKKAQDNELKFVLTDIIGSFKRHEEAMTKRIIAMGGTPNDTLGFLGEISEAWEEIKLMVMDSDAEVCNAAIKAIEMGLKNGNKFIDEHKDLAPDVLSDMKAIVDDYDSSLMKVKKIRDKFE